MTRIKLISTFDICRQELFITSCREVRGKRLYIDPKNTVIIEKDKALIMLYARKDEFKKNRLQTLAEHSRSVSGMVAQTCRSIGLASFGILLGLLHDLGKSFDEWQDYMLYGLAYCSHSPAGARFILDRFGTSEDAYKKLTAQMLALIIHGHHTGLHDVLSPNGEDITGSLLRQDNAAPIEESNAFWHEVATLDDIDRLFEEAVLEIKALCRKCTLPAKAFPDLRSVEARNTFNMSLGLALRFSYSALVDADRSDAARWEDELPWGQHTAVQLSAWEEMRASTEHHIAGLSTNGDINEIRSEISDTCKNFAIHGPGVYRLYVPTGGGKTLASLRLALALATPEIKHIFYIVPYLTILEQNADVLRKAIGDPEAVLEHHSNIVRDEDRENDISDQRRKLTERWEAPVVITTLVQFLNALFSGKSSAARRMHSLANSIIILDEIQSMPIHCLYLFNNAVGFLNHICGSTIILCTATQPALASLRYPLRLSQPADIIPDVAEKFMAFKRTEIVFMVKSSAYSTPEAAVFIDEKLTETGSVLAVMNTKSAARQLYEQLLPVTKQGTALYYLSTDVCPAHRREIIKTIQQLLGKNKPVICVSTQLIEAGVDISFNCVVRALAGLESIIQAAGRCNRNGDDIIKIRNVYVIDGGSNGLDKLPDIMRGYLASIRLLDDYRKQPEIMGKDILSPQAIERYYTYYYQEQKLRLEYQMEGNYSAVDLLGSNDNARTEFRSRYRQEYPAALLRQSFATVGQQFEVISEGTTGVIVPYRYGKELIGKIKAATSIKEKRIYLQQAQSYTVNAYENALKKLISRGAITVDNELGIIMLEEGWYDPKLGIIVDNTDDLDRYFV